MAFRVTGQSLGMMVNWFNPHPDIQQKLYTMRRSETLFQNAQSFSGKYRDYDPAAAVNRIVSYISSR